MQRGVIGRSAECFPSLVEKRTVSIRSGLRVYIMVTFPDNRPADRRRAPRRRRVSPITAEKSNYKEIRGPQQATRTASSDTMMQGLAYDEAVATNPLEELSAYSIQFDFVKGPLPLALLFPRSTPLVL